MSTCTRSRSARSPGRRVRGCAGSATARGATRSRAGRATALALAIDNTTVLALPGLAIVVLGAPRRRCAPALRLWRWPPRFVAPSTRIFRCAARRSPRSALDPTLALGLPPGRPFWDDGHPATGPAFVRVVTGASSRPHRALRGDVRAADTLRRSRRFVPGVVARRRRRCCRGSRCSARCCCGGACRSSSPALFALGLVAAAVRRSPIRSNRIRTRYFLAGLLRDRRGGRLRRRGRCSARGCRASRATRRVRSASRCWRSRCTPTDGEQRVLRRSRRSRSPAAFDRARDRATPRRRDRRRAVAVRDDRSAYGAYVDARARRAHRVDGRRRTNTQARIGSWLRSRPIVIVSDDPLQTSAACTRVELDDERHRICMRFADCWRRRAAARPLRDSLRSRIALVASRGRSDAVRQLRAARASVRARARSRSIGRATGSTRCPTAGATTSSRRRSRRCCCCRGSRCSAAPTRRLLALLLCGVAVGCCWLCCERVGATPRTAAWVCAFMFAGTQLWWCAMLGDVWFIAHVAAVAMHVRRAGRTGRRAARLARRAGGGRGGVLALLAGAGHPGLRVARAAPAGRRPQRRASALGFGAVLAPARPLWVGVQPGALGRVVRHRLHRVVPPGQRRRADRLAVSVAVSALSAVVVFRAGAALRARSGRSSIPDVRRRCAHLDEPGPRARALRAPAARGSSSRCGWRRCSSPAPSFIYYVNGFAQFGMRHALDFEPFLVMLMALALAQRVRSLIAEVLIGGRVWSAAGACGSGIRSIVVDEGELPARRLRPTRYAAQIGRRVARRAERVRSQARLLGDARAERARARRSAGRCGSSCRSIARRGCTTISGSKPAACWRRGRFPKDRRSTRTSGGSRCTSRIIRYDYGGFEGIIPERQLRCRRSDRVGSGHLRARRRDRSGRRDRQGQDQVHPARQEAARHVHARQDQESRRRERRAVAVDQGSRRVRRSGLQRQRASRERDQRQDARGHRRQAQTAQDAGRAIAPAPPAKKRAPVAARQSRSAAARHQRRCSRRWSMRPFDDPAWLFEVKWDGYRAIATIDAEGKVDADVAQRARFARTLQGVRVDRAARFARCRSSSTVRSARSTRRAGRRFRPCSRSIARARQGAGYTAGLRRLRSALCRRTRSARAAARGTQGQARSADRPRSRRDLLQAHRRPGRWSSSRSRSAKGSRASSASGATRRTARRARATGSRSRPSSRKSS